MQGAVPSCSMLRRQAFGQSARTRCISALHRGRSRPVQGLPRSEGDPDYRVRRTIPIFPLNVVALPAATVPLMIFEARYRVLFSTLLSGMEGIEEGLVNQDSPWCGTKRFGMVYVDNEGRMAQVGTTLEIMDFQNIADGRLFVSNKGRERFRILNIVKEKPVLLCEVEVIQESEETEEAKELAREVAELLRNTIRLNLKMQMVSLSDEQLEPQELNTLGPRELSYWVASFFSDVKVLQQNLLEEDDTVRRLEKEKSVLSETVRYYSAAAALKSAFGPGAIKVSEEDAGAKTDLEAKSIPEKEDSNRQDSA